MRSMACQLAVQSDSSEWVYYVNEDSNEFKRAVSFAIPTEKHVEERRSMILSQCDIVSRLPPVDDEQLAPVGKGGGIFPSTDKTSLYSYSEYASQSAIDALARVQTPLQYACSTFVGRVVSSSELESTTPHERFSNSWLFYGSGIWINPCPNGTLHKHREFHLADNVFGERYDIESDIHAMEMQFDYGRNDSEKITHELWRTGALGPQKCVKSDDDALEKLNLYFQEQNPLLTVLNGQNATRQLILKRFRHLTEGKKYNRRIQNSLIRFRNKKGNLRPCIFLEVFSTVDLFKFMIGCLRPCDMVQLLKTTKWEDDIGQLIKHRMPSLCIYELSGSFPHMKDGNGNAIVHKEAQIRLAVGIRYERKRQKNTESQEGASVIHTFDAAYTCEGAKNYASLTTFPLKMEEDTEIVTIPYHAYFTKPPNLDFELMDARTGLPYDIQCRFGGMTPSVALRKVYGQGKEVRLWCNINIQQLRTLPSSNLAVLAQFGLKNVCAKDRVFKIVATASGIQKGTTDTSLVLQAESMPFYIRSSKSNAEKAPAAKRLRTM